LEQFGDFIIDRAFVEGEFFRKQQSREFWNQVQVHFERLGTKNIGWKKVTEAITNNSFITDS
jgi:hypothetical protein